MDIGETIKQLNETHPYWPAIATGIGVLVGYVVGRIHDSTKSKEDYNSAIQVQEVQQKSAILGEQDTDYKPSSIADAVRSCDDSQIQGHITEFHTSLTGYSGIIVDSSGKVLFYMDEGHIDSYEEEGLVPILFKHSKETRTPIKMNGFFEDYNKIFIISWLGCKMNNIDYEV